MEARQDPSLQDEPCDLRSVVVRLVRPGERAEWDRLLREHHYLGFRGWVGESLRYVAEEQGRWLALLGWCAAALKCQARDHWIGWPEVLKWQRLPLVVNNARFLILPGRRVANLASRVLALNLKRLSQDWQVVHGHPVFLAETFVDPRRFAGTCYRAAGWLELGATRGYRRRAGRYEAHGEPKIVWVRALVPQAAQRLRTLGAEPMTKSSPRPIQLSAAKAEELLRVLMRLPDGRQRRGRRHDQMSILAVAICAVLGGARSYVAMGQWAQRCSQNLLKRLGCRREARSGRYVAPSEPTIRRRLQDIDAQQVDRALSGWYASLTDGTSHAVAIDGKTLRGAHRADGSQVHLLSAVLHGVGVTLGQCEVEQKSNEICAAPVLLADLELEGRVVTADALHTQQELARWLVEDKQADYVFTVKDNQPTLRQDLADWFEPVAFPPSGNDAG
ncbi:MAG TPA: ISAs1 family transposase [Burkholderiales bacterium]|nr:ISAs1 family transposase [Burkholderiales bacterium]